MDIQLLTLEKILEIHADLANRYGLPSNGAKTEICDMTSLKQVLDCVQAVSIDNSPDHLGTIAGEYLFDLIHKHPFAGANLRTGAACALYFLELNGIETPVDERLCEEVLDSVVADRMSKAAVGDFFNQFIPH